MNITFRANIPKIPDVGLIIESLTNALYDVVEPELKREHEKYIKSWTGIEIVAKRGSDTNGVYTHLKPDGPMKDKWSWTSKGTRPHRITPNGPYPLKVRLGYTPKTFPGGVYTGPGKYSGPVRNMKAVDHPGNAPRDFESIIKRDYAARFYDIMFTARRDGVARARGL